MQDASQYRQTVPVEAEDTEIRQLPEHRDDPPPYISPEEHRSATVPELAAEQQPAEAATNTTGVDNTGYEAPEPMSCVTTWEEKERGGYWNKYDGQTGCFCSNRGGWFCSDRGGRFFSDREGWWCSDRGGLFFSDRGGICFSDNNGRCFS